MKKALVAVLALALTAGGFAAASDKFINYGIGYGTETITEITTSSYNKVITTTCDFSGIDLLFDWNYALGSSPVFITGGFDFLFPLASSYTSAGKTTVIDDSKFAYSVNPNLGFDLHLKTQSPFSFGFFAGIAVNATAVYSEKTPIAALLLGAAGKAYIQYAFAKDKALLLSVNDKYYFLSLHDSDDKITGNLFSINLGLSVFQ